MLRACYQNKLTEAGCDEAGRGCLAGPVFAAAVILPKRFRHSLLNDSKLMKEDDRYVLRDLIREKAIAWAVASISHEEIDRINILRASLKAMHLALDQLTTKPEFILVDGNIFTPYGQVPHKCMIRGDSAYFSIAAASILAKTYRDDLMKQLHMEYPVYGWDSNKGYATEFHRKAIEKDGYSPYHRKTFHLQSLSNIGQLSLNLPHGNSNFDKPVNS